MNYEVPFFPNSEDDTHCVQASLLMVIKYFHPEKEYTWKELEDITAKDEKHWTWPLAMLLWLHDNNYEVEVVDLFDYEEFANRGGQYIIDEVGEEVGKAQIANSDIPAEQERAKLVKDKIVKKTQIPNEDDIKLYLKNGYLVLCRVNSRILNGQNGYMGHSIIVKGYDEEGLIIHDPGLPPLKDRHVASKEFEKAWAYPDKPSRNLTAIRHNI